VTTDERIGFVRLGDSGDQRALLAAQSMVIFTSFFEFGTRSAVRTFATRKSIFIKSSIVMRWSIGIGGGAVSAAGTAG